MTNEPGHHCRHPNVHEIELRSDNRHREANMSSYIGR
jgi:hypothetical protein